MRNASPVCGLILAAAISCARADEIVKFDAARYGVGELQQRLARERGETLARPPLATLQGYLSRPDGNGPFPAIVYLHGCLGLSEFRRTSTAAQMTGWGYVTLVVDSFATRGITENCSARLADGQTDALGALLYVSRLPFVDPHRIALVGASQGGIAALEVASARPSEIFEMPAGLKYKAVVAFYPSCSAAEDQLAIPALVLTGGLDDWSLAKECDWWMQRRGGKGAPVKIVVYPEAYHSFDNPKLPIATRFFGHWLKYDADAAARAAAEMRNFLAAQLK